MTGGAAGAMRERIGASEELLEPRYFSNAKQNPFGIDLGNAGWRVGFRVRKFDRRASRWSVGTPACGRVPLALAGSFEPRREPPVRVDGIEGKDIDSMAPRLPANRARSRGAPAPGWRSSGFHQPRRTRRHALDKRGRRRLAQRCTV